MHRPVVGLLLCTTYQLAFMQPVSAADQAPWSSRVEWQGNVGSERSMARGEVLLPGLNAEDAILYFNFGGSLFTDSREELNAGVGVRGLMSRPGGSDYIVGIYGALESAFTTHDNSLHRFVVGTEWFTDNIDLRVNFYAPEKRLQRTTTQPLYEVDIGASSVQFFESVELERLLPGFYGELGARKEYGSFTARAAIGGFHFWHDDIDEDRTGVTGKIEFLSPELWMDAQKTQSFGLVAGVEAETDFSGETHFMGVIRLVAGFGGGRQIEQHQLARRMTDMPLRYNQWVDGQQTERFQTPIKELNRVTINAQSGQDIQSTLDQYRDQSIIVILDGTTGDFIMERSLNLYPGQILIGNSVLGSLGLPELIVGPNTSSAFLSDNSSNNANIGLRSTANPMILMQGGTADTTLIMLNTSTAILGVDVTGGLSGEGLGLATITIENASRAILHKMNTVDVAMVIKDSNHVVVDSVALEATTDVSGNRKGITLSDVDYVKIQKSNITNFGKLGTEEVGGLSMENSISNLLLESLVLDQVTPEVSVRGIWFNESPVNNVAMRNITISGYNRGISYLVPTGSNSVEVTNLDITSINEGILIESVTNEGFVMKGGSIDGPLTAIFVGGVADVNASSLSPLKLEGVTISNITNDVVSEVSGGVLKELEILDSTISAVGADMIAVNGGLTSASVKNTNISGIGGSLFNITGFLADETKITLEGNTISSIGGDLIALN